MHSYTIMPLHAGHEKEMAEDIRRQVATGTATMPLFIMTLVPEGQPPIDKAGLLCAKYDRIKPLLDADGVPSGVLAQATIGHGYALNEMFGFQQVITLSDGTPNNIVCPLDPAFREHMRGQFRTMASRHPAMIMVDDDFRLLARKGHGCGCPLHVGLFNKLSGKNYTREELFAHLDSGKPEDDEDRRIFIEVNREALVGAAKFYRAGIDDIDPKIPGSFCCCGDSAEFADEIAAVMAGEGNPVILRINNGRYTAPGARGLIHSMRRAAKQIAVTKGKVDIYLAETDTCPQNRYSTAAYSLHAHFTGSILEGCAGAKHWITRTRTFEPNSGLAYRRLLSKYAGFYQTLADTVPKLTWRGCRQAIPQKPDYNFSRYWGGYWADCVLERLGLPMFFSAQQGGALFLDFDDDAMLSDEELKEAFAHAVFASAPAAERLTKRGFGAYLGVHVQPWNGLHPSYEKMSGTGKQSNVQMGVCEIVIDDPAVRTESTVCHLHNGKDEMPLFPGVTSYTNPAGGKTVVFSGTPRAAFNYQEAFSFLNETRKGQILRLLKEAGECPVAYAGDAEVYARCADIEGEDAVFAAFINVGLDPLDDLPLAAEKEIRAVARLTADGTWQPVPFAPAEDGTYTVQATACVLDSVVVKVWFK